MVNDKWGGCHGENRGGQKILPQCLVQQSVLGTDGGQNKGELTHLKEGKGAHVGCPARVGEGSHCQQHGHHFDEHHHQCQCQHDVQVCDEKLYVEQHTDGNKEKAGEYFPERQYNARRLVAVLRLRDNQPRQKGTQCQRQPCLIGAPGYDKADDEDREDKQLTVARTCNSFQYFGYKIARTVQHHGHDGYRPQQQAEQLSARHLFFAGQDGGQQHHGYYNDVLKNQYGQCDAPVGSVVLTP